MRRSPLLLAACAAVSWTPSCMVDELVEPAPIATPAGVVDPGPRGRCVKQCDGPEDCCFTAQCTGAGYVCQDGLCAEAECQTTEQCTSGDQFPTRACLAVEGIRQCEYTCSADKDCFQLGPLFTELRCIGQSDDGSPVCRLPVPQPECVEGLPNQCFEGGLCTAGECTCATPVDCNLGGDAVWACLR